MLHRADADSRVPLPMILGYAAQTHQTETHSTNQTSETSHQHQKHSDGVLGGSRASLSDLPKHKQSIRNTEHTQYIYILLTSVIRLY